MMTVLVLASCTSKSGTADATSSGRVSSAAATSVVTSSAPLTATRVKPTNTVNDLKSNSAHHDAAVDGESFTLKVDYWTTIDASTWGAIGPKDVHLLAYLNPAAGVKAPEVMIDEFDVEYSLAAANSGLDGLVIAHQVDHAYTSIPGFLVTSKISYGTAFATAGIGSALLERWQSLGGPLPLEEASLQLAGVYAVEVSFVYRLLVRNIGDTGWHRRTVLDHLVVPVKAVKAPAPSAAVTSPAAAVTPSSAVVSKSTG